jgi:transcriptional regulator with XRE-family HTH domain
MENVYKNIRKRRLELGMTQSELARAAGYENRSSIARIERGDTNLPQSKIINIARALKVTPSYLMGWEDEEVATLTAMQEETMARFLMLTYEHQLVVRSIVDTLTEQEKG